MANTTRETTNDNEPSPRESQATVHDAMLVGRRLIQLRYLLNKSTTELFDLIRETHDKKLYQFWGFDTFEGFAEEVLTAQRPDLGQVFANMVSEAAEAGRAGLPRLTPEERDYYAPDENDAIPEGFD